jgi:hypothetical protein
MSEASVTARLASLDRAILFSVRDERQQVVQLFHSQIRRTGRRDRELAANLFAGTFPNRVKSETENIRVASNTELAHSTIINTACLLVEETIGRKTRHINDAPSLAHGCSPQKFENLTAETNLLCNISHSIGISPIPNRSNMPVSDVCLCRDPCRPRCRPQERSEWLDGTV